MGVRNKLCITVTSGLSTGFMSSTNPGHFEIVVSGLHFIST
jgi:hypothetical protein